MNEHIEFIEGLVKNNGYYIYRIWVRVEAQTTLFDGSVYAVALLHESLNPITYEIPKKEVTLAQTMELSIMGKAK